MGRVSCVRFHLVCWPIGLATRPISIWLACPVLDPLILILFGQGNFWIYAIAMMVNAWSYNFDSGTSTAFLI